MYVYVNVNVHYFMSVHIHVVWKRNLGKGRHSSRVNHSYVLLIKKCTVNRVVCSDSLNWPNSMYSKYMYMLFR